jgi:hypothetical protein
MVSCGSFNPFGIPRPDNKECIAAAGAHTCLPITQGCLKLIADSRAWRVKPYLYPHPGLPLATALIGGEGQPAELHLQQSLLGVDACAETGEAATSAQHAMAWQK